MVSINSSSNLGNAKNFNSGSFDNSNKEKIINLNDKDKIFTFGKDFDGKTINVNNKNITVKIQDGAKINLNLNSDCAKVNNDSSNLNINGNGGCADITTTGTGNTTVAGKLGDKTKIENINKANTTVTGNVGPDSILTNSSNPFDDGKIEVTGRVGDNATLTSTGSNNPSNDVKVVANNLNDRITIDKTGITLPEDASIKEKHGDNICRYLEDGATLD